MHFTMQKKINAKVLIYSKSLFNKIPKGYEKVVLEYEKFNKNMIYMCKIILIVRDR